MTVRTLYGGYQIGLAELSDANKKQKYSNVNLRTRRVKEANPEDGDVIVTHSAATKAYTAILYTENGLYGIKADGTFGKLDPALLSSCAYGTARDYLDTLTAYTQFLVLRPALLG